LISKSIIKIAAKLIYFILSKYSKFNNNKDKTSNILIKALNIFYSKLKKYNLDIIASIFVEIIKISFKVLEQVIYC